MPHIDVNSGPVQFRIEYFAFDDVLIIDGVRCSPEVIRMLFVAPKPDVLLRFERKLDQVTVTQVLKEGWK